MPSPRILPLLAGACLLPALLSGCTRPATVAAPVPVPVVPPVAAPAPAQAPLVLAPPPGPTPEQQKAQADAAYNQRALAYQRAQSGAAPPSALEAYRQSHFVPATAQAGPPQALTSQQELDADLAARSMVRGMQYDSAHNRQRVTVPSGGSLVITTEDR